MDNPLDLLMNPRSIVYFGGSNALTTLGTAQLVSLMEANFEGPIYPVHPREETVLGVKAYKSVLDLPEVPDLAVMVINNAHLPKVMEECGQKGVRRAVVVTAGYGEMGREGEERQAGLLEIAQKHGIRFLGPNCMGAVNSRIGLNTTWYHYRGGRGHLGIVSQSGSYVTQMLPHFHDRGINVSQALSVGNQADLDVVDCLYHLGQDPDTRAIAIYLEALKRPRAFLETARLITPMKPVVALYVGGTQAGARAGGSHTGAVAGPDHLYEGLFRQAGVIRAETVDQLYDFGLVLASQPLPAGRRMGILTNSGGPGASLAHECDRAGLEVPPFDREFRDKLAELTPHTASAANPVDITMSYDLDLLFSKLPDLILSREDVDGLFFYGAFGSELMREKLSFIARRTGQEDHTAAMDIMERFSEPLQKLLVLAARHGKPVLSASFQGPQDSLVRTIREAGIPVLPSPERAVRAMEALCRYREARERLGLAALEPAQAQTHPLLARALEEGRKSLSEHESKLLLADHGLPVNKGVLVDRPENFLDACREVGFPLAMKACSADHSHKSESNLVRLDIRHEHEAEIAYAELGLLTGGAVLVQEMVRGGRELVMGLVRDDLLGPMVMFGLGGILTEMLKDFTFRPAPLTQEEALAMLDEIRASAVLGPVRGMPAADRQALARMLVNLGNLALMQPRVREIDLNPVLLAGESPVAVDALVLLD